MTSRSPVTLEAVAAARWRMAIGLTAAMMFVYFGFILLVAFNKPLLGTIVTRGLSLGILLGALVIVVAWILTWVYVSWANRHYDAAIEQLGSRGRRVH
ncbi:MAG TPA: DUF485 domain-containing protein [Vicinamibacterales bacterium]|jgi:uncharacterized membrane protein (DUF485 family)